MKFLLVFLPLLCVVLSKVDVSEKEAEDIAAELFVDQTAEDLSKANFPIGDDEKPNLIEIVTQQLKADDKLQSELDKAELG